MSAYLPNYLIKNRGCQTFESFFSAVCVERVPTLVPELSALQQRMIAMLRQIEFEQSKKCDHELRHEDDL